MIYSKPEIHAIEAWITLLLGQTRPFEPTTAGRRALREGVARLIAPLL